jgi:imidazolonepropionase-like amidohydrolase
MRCLVFAATLLIGAPVGGVPIAITNATVWTMANDKPVEDATITIDHGRIVSIEANGRVPDGAERISANHHIVTPTLVDAATQIGLGEVGGIDEEHRGGVDSGPLGAAFEVAYGFDADDQAVRQARADGVGWAMIYPDTSARAPFDGTAAWLALGTDKARIERPKAAIVVTIGGSSAARVGGSTTAAWQLLRNALDDAKSFGPHATSRSADHLTRQLDAATLKPVLAGSMPLIIQCDRLADIHQAISLARDYRVKMILFGGAEAWAAARELAEAKIPVILDPMASLPDSYDRIGARADSAALLAAAGVPLAFSVSAQGIYRSWNAGPSMREGAGLAVASGLPYAVALRAITSSAAEIIGLAPGIGKLGAGAQADLVIWDGDPLEPSSAPELVMIGGKRVSPVTRQTLLRDRYVPNH